MVSVYKNSQQNGLIIPRSLCRGVVTVIRKDPVEDNCRPITQLNAELKILATVLAKLLTCVTDGLIGET